MRYPLPTYQNFPWKTSRAVTFQALVTGSWFMGAFTFDGSKRFSMVPEVGDSTGHAYLFDTLSIGSTLSREDWQKSVQGSASATLYSSQSGESLFNSPIPLIQQAEWLPIRQLWIPSGSPSELSVGVNAKFSGIEMMGYEAPTIKLSFTAYDIVDRSFIEALSRGWSEVSDLDDKAAKLGENVVALKSGDTTLRRFQ